MALNVDAFLNTVTTHIRALPVVILYVTEECNLQCITCSYRKALPGELTLQEIAELARKLTAFGLRRIAYSGGEPLMRRDFPAICEIFKQHGVNQTLLTNGLLLQKRLPEITGYFSEIVVSIDGADAETHNAIRGAAVFDRIILGVRRALDESPGAQVSIRTVVQKRNFRQIPKIIEMAHALGVHHVSFLAADMETDAFGRAAAATTEEGACVLLDDSEVSEFRALIDEMAVAHARDFLAGFIAQSPGALRHIVSYYAALRGLCPLPENRCNAPMVSAVITSTGTVKPCFFLPGMGNVRTADVATVVNSAAAKATRVAVTTCSPDACKKCVCTLRVSSASALFNRF